MIFVTVGTQLPFDRLIRAFDDWMADHSDVECLAQVGKTTYRPTNMPWKAILSREVLQQTMERAELIVSHAGMGTIITSLTLAKPVLIMPRVSRFGEQRNDHQLATARALGRRPNVYVAADETEVAARLDELVPAPAFVGDSLGPFAEPDLLDAVRDAIASAWRAS